MIKQEPSLLYQLHHGKLPEVFYNSFTNINSIHVHDTRFKDSATYFLPRVNKNFCKNQLSYRGNKLWSELNSNYKNMHWVSSKNKFKKKSSKSLLTIICFFLFVFFLVDLFIFF